MRAGGTNQARDCFIIAPIIASYDSTNQAQDIGTPRGDPGGGCPSWRCALGFIEIYDSLIFVIHYDSVIYDSLRFIVFGTNQTQTVLKVH